jgi:hypothetical protein
VEDGIAWQLHTTYGRRLRKGDNMLNGRLSPFVRENYEVQEWKHASAILTQDYPDEWADILAVLEGFRLKKSWISEGGGRKSKVSEHIDSFLYKRGWVEKKFETGVILDGTPMLIIPRVI